MDEFSREAFALLTIGIVTIGLRTYWRISSFGLARLQADDYLMLLAAVVYAVETTLAYSVGAFWRGLANNSMSDEYRASLDPDGEEYRIRVNGSKTQVAGWSTYTFLLWILKSCMCVFLLRLTEGLPKFQNRVYLGFIFIATTWLVVLLCILFGCGLPFEKNWQINPDPGNLCQPAISNIDIFVTVVFNALTDLYLLAIPAVMLYQVSLPLRKRIGFMVLFSGGIFITTAGILRCVLIFTDPINGAQQAGSWAVRETFVAVMMTNLPIVGPAVHKWGHGLLWTLQSLKTGAKSLGVTSGDRLTPGPGSYPMNSSGNSRNRARGGGGPKTANPLPTFSESEERIMEQGQAAGPRQAVADQGHDGGGIHVTKQFEVHVEETRRRGASSSSSDGSHVTANAGQPLPTARI